MKPDIVKETDNYIVIHKPSGLATQTARMGEKDLVSEVKNYLAENGKKNPYLAVINRLDQPVEGLVLMAKNDKAAAALSRQLENGCVQKYYYAELWGHLPNEQGTLENYLIKDSKSNTSKVVANGTLGAKRAELEYELVKRCENTDVVRIHLLTGRHHQIRVQFSNAGNPLIGDSKYGSEQSVAYGKKMGIRWVRLKAYKLSFTDPATKESVNIELDMI